MSGRFVLSPQAQDDLEAIADYSFQRWGADQAEFYLRRLTQHIQAVALQPKAGIACPELRHGYYKSRSGSHFVFYRLIDDGIDVVRILHQRMDFTRHFR